MCRATLGLHHLIDGQRWNYAITLLKYNVQISYHHSHTQNQQQSNNGSN